MVITSDIVLKGDAWNKAIESLKDIFEPRINYGVFMLSLAIGIMYDQSINELPCSAADYKSVPRNVIKNNENGKLDFYFQAAIMTSCHVELSEEERLNIAFADTTDFNKINFLLSFANFGVTKLVEKIGSTPAETMDNIMLFLDSSISDNNIDLDSFLAENN